MDFQVTPLDNQRPEPSPPQKKGLRAFKFMFMPNLKLVFFGAFLIIAVGVLFFFLGRSSFNDEKVELQIEGPSEVKGGELVNYKLVYKNTSGVALSGAKLTFSYPEDSIVIKDGKITDVENEIVEIDRLSEDESGEMEFRAYIVGDRGNIKQAQAVMTFRPSNLSTVIKREAVLSTTITSLPVSLALVAPPSATNGEEITYIIDYRNETDDDMENLKLAVDLPDSFSAIKFTPNPLSGLTWGIPSLKSGEGSRITILGTLRGGERESKTISAVLQRQVEVENGQAEEYIDFQKATAFTVISSPFLSLSATVGGSRSYSASLGDRLRYVIDFKNDTASSLLGLTLSARLEGDMFELDSVESDGFFDSRQNTIFWNSSSLPELGLLEAGQSGRVEFEVRLKREFPGGVVGSQTSLIKVSSKIETPNVPPDLGVSVLSSEDELITRISSNVSFSQNLLVNDDQWGSFGPFPPRVNQKTTLTVKWELTNPINLISPAKITATLAPGVVWENKIRVSAGSSQPSFNPNSSEVSWDIGSLPGGTGTAFPAYEGFFQVSITPSVNQAGDRIDILRDIKFEGTDSFTKQEIVKTLRDLNISESVQP